MLELGTGDRTTHQKILFLDDTCQLVLLDYRDRDPADRTQTSPNEMTPQNLTS